MLVFGNPIKVRTRAGVRSVQFLTQPVRSCAKKNRQRECEICQSKTWYWKWSRGLGCVVCAVCHAVMPKYQFTLNGLPIPKGRCTKAPASSPEF
jgi:hypothetical protein